ncbi:MAG: Uma2 family endonuclease [Candidatus Eremiobacteraeota bacterium]|nr:Uma2 family endonuclease [Candidatus Eremiobacteraeota bacterium]
MVNYVMDFGVDLLHRYSDEDIEELVRRNPGLQFERTPEGRLLVSPPNGWLGGRRDAALVLALGNWNVRSGNGGTVLGSSAGFTLPDGALFAPDASWLNAERFAQLRARQPLDKFAPASPNLVFEIVSPTDRINAVRRKIETYVRNGVTCAVLIDPERHLVEISTQDRLHTPASDASRLTIPLDLLAGALAPFELELTELFTAAT